MTDRTRSRATTLTAPDLEGVRQGRIAVAEAMAALESALASPAAAGSEFVIGVSTALTHLVGIGVDQLDNLEDEGGLLDDIVRDAPRLAHRVATTRELRSELRSHLADVEAATATLTAGRGDPESLRRAGLALLGEVARYRQRVTDLVYEAYYVDLGGPG